MDKQTIQNKINQKTKELEELNKKLQEINEKVEWLDIPNTDLEVSKNVLYKGKSYDEIMKLKKPEEELLTLKQIGIILENKELTKELKMDGSSTKDDFFFKQPFPQNEKKGYIARFYSYSYCSGFCCVEDSVCSDSGLGVRFVRKKSKGIKCSK